MIWHLWMPAVNLSQEVAEEREIENELMDGSDSPIIFYVF